MFEWYYVATFAILLGAYSIWQLIRLEARRANRSIQDRMEEYAKMAVSRARKDQTIDLDYELDSIQN